MNKEYLRQKQKQYLKNQLSSTRILRVKNEYKDEFEFYRGLVSQSLGYKFTINEMFKVLLDVYKKTL